MKNVRLVFLLLAACEAPQKAPVELDELSHYLFRNHTDQDDEVVADGLRNLETLLSPTMSSSTAFQDRSWTIKPLTDEAVSTLRARPDRPLQNLLGSAVSVVSEQSILCHAVLQAQADQLPVEPTANHYVRSFEDTDPECFRTGTCSEMHTFNDVTRASILFTAKFELFKNFRWVSYQHDGQERRAFYSRSWYEKSWDSEDGPGGNQLWQSYSIDVWIDRGTDVLRFQVLWTETELYVGGAAVDDETQLATVASSTDGIFSAGERYIRDTLRPQGSCR